MESRLYYLPVNSQSLAHYMGSACIKPGNYFTNKPKDLQDRYANYLLLTTHFGTIHTDCCLELVLTLQEAEELIDIHDGFFLYGRPLPISRIKGIYFTSQEQAERTITNICMSTAFVPKQLVHVAERFEPADMEQTALPDVLPSFEPYMDETKRFDQYLGGFALLRLAGESYMNYSENYFSVLAFFSEVIEQELEAAGHIVDKRFWGVFTGGYGFHKIYPILNKEVTEEDVNALAQEEHLTIRKNPITKVIDLNALDKNTYLAAVLYTYGIGIESKKKKIDELILSHFRNGIKTEKVEGIALCYGLNRGYTVLQNQYTAGNQCETVKFLLNSRLDYYTIESIYQYAFYSRRSKSIFDYIDNWCPKVFQPAPSHENEYRILDVTAVGKRKCHTASMLAETQAAYRSKNEVRKIVNNTLKYSTKDLETLKNEAQSKGISIPSDITREELIVLLVTTPIQR